MRQSSGSPVVRRATAVVFAAALVMLLALPGVAQAATYRSTLRLSTRYQTKARTLTLSGSINRKTKGKYISVEIRKPGRSYWVAVKTARISKYGRWSAKYAPKLAGRFYFRARYGSKLSRSIGLTVKKGPGTKTLIYMASTTSTKDSGVWEALKPAFLHSSPEYADVPAVFVGSGASIQQGKDKNVDIVLTHSAAAEIAAVNGGWLKDRHSVMFNDFVVVGPKTNPAGVVLGGTPGAAFQAIATAGSTFISRNDASGTNTQEKAIWSSISNPQTGQAWYKATGTMGMAEALSATNDQLAYTLSDRATWLNWLNLNGGFATPPSAKIVIKVVNDNPPLMKNQYSVLSVVGARNSEGAADFNAWIRSAEAQNIIRTYGVSTFGQPLFFPNAGLY